MKFILFTNIEEIMGIVSRHKKNSSKAFKQGLSSCYNS